LRTAAAWFAAGCPGQPGAYDLDQIAAWRNQPRQATVHRQSAPAAAIAELAAAVDRLVIAIEQSRKPMV
jgi:hypothetical protein